MVRFKVHKNYRINTYKSLNSRMYFNKLHPVLTIESKNYNPIAFNLLLSWALWPIRIYKKHYLLMNNIVRVYLL